MMNNDVYFLTKIDIEQYCPSNLIKYNKSHFPMTMPMYNMITSNFYIKYSTDQRNISKINYRPIHLLLNNMVRYKGSH